MRTTLLILLLLLLAACRGDVTHPGNLPGGLVVTLEVASDTPGSPERWVEARLLTRRGDVVPGALVHFRFEHPDFVLSNPGPDSAYTDPSGVARLQIRAGNRAGEAWVVASAAADGALQDSALFTVVPGQPVASLDMQYFAYADQPYPLKVLLRDRLDNRWHAEPLRCESADARVTLQGCTAIAPFGTYDVRVESAWGLHTRSLSGLLPGILAAPRPNNVHLLEFDATILGWVENYDGRRPAWIPGTDSLVVLIDRVLHIAHAHGGGRRRLVAGMDPTLVEDWPAVSPDGQWIYYSRRHTGTVGAELWRVRRDGSGAARIGPPTSSGRTDVQAAVNADGSRVVYISSAAGSAGEVRILDVNSGTVHDTGVSGMRPKWRPGSEWISYLSPVQSSIVPLGELRQIDGNGNAGPTLHPRVQDYDWSQDGAYFVAAANVCTSLLVSTCNGSLWQQEAASGVQAAMPHVQAAPGGESTRGVVITNFAWRR